MSNSQSRLGTYYTELPMFPAFVSYERTRLISPYRGHGEQCVENNVTFYFHILQQSG